MMEAQETVLVAGASDPRAEFVASIGRRLSAVRTGLRELEAEPRSASRRDVVLRRLHALGAASRVLGFDAAAEALGSAENSLYRSAATGEVLVRDLAEVTRAIDQVPSLVWGGTPDATPASGVESSAEGHPVHVVAFVDSSLERAMEANDPEANFEYDAASDAVRAIDLVRATGPDVVIVDIDKDGASDLVDLLLTDDLVEPFALVVVGTLQGAEAAATFVARGAKRVLPKPVSPETLERAILGVARRGTDLAAAHEALGDVTIEELSARIAAEVHRGLVESQRQGSLGATVPFGEGVDVLAAVWSAVARVREIATLRSGGSLRFEATGPEGAIPLAPWASPDRRAGERNTRGSRGHDGVRLEGRLAVVADDDPSVVWFLSGLLKTAGVDVLEAHDGKRALELTLSRWPDLVVSDVLMPKMDGFSLCRAIKRDVAVRDVPVVLLSWKEDLLQRLRELGADADAYLRKEAAGTTVLERIREVLRPRARVEARMVTGGVVRGRLDGLTPRLVLELACGRHRDCRVSFRDSVYLYEVDIRGGHPVNATRTATDGGFARGEKVIAALLGIGAGRFSVAPESMVCRDNLNKSLADLLSPHIMRARRAQDAVVGGLDRIDSIQIDVEAISAYLAATPDPALHLLQRLTSGHSPAELARDPETDRQALEAVLLDTARRGAILDLTVAGRAIDLDAPVDEPEAEQPASAPPQFTLELSPGGGEAVPLPPSTELSPKWPMDPNVTPGLDFQEHATGFRDESGTFPGVGPGSARAMLAPVQDAAVGSKEAAKHAEDIAAKDATGDAVPVEASNAAAKAPTSGDVKAIDESWDPGQAEEPQKSKSAHPLATTAASAAHPVQPAPHVPRPDPVAPAAIDGFPRVKEVRLPTPLRSKAEPKGVEALDDRDSSEAPVAADHEPSLAASSVADKASESAAPSVGAKADAVEDAQADDDADADANARADADVQADDDEAGDARAGSDNEDSDAADAAPSESSGSVQGEGKKMIPETQRSEPTLPKTKSIAFPSKAQQAKQKEEVPLPDREFKKDDASSEAKAAAPAAESKLLGFAKVAAVMGAAGVASFMLVSWIRGAGGDVPAGPAAQASVPGLIAPAAAPPAPKKEVAAPPKGVKVESLPLPPGIELASGKGLLEISISEKDAIYVDDTFVGRGPLKRVPLEPGEHSVKLRKPGEEVTHSVKIEAGSRTRLSQEDPK